MLSFLAMTLLINGCASKVPSPAKKITKEMLLEQSTALLTQKTLPRAEVIRSKMANFEISLKTGKETNRFAKLLG